MLVALRIKNLALVEDLSLDFTRGFNSITGETGAGKSILIGALSLVLGERADRNWIRTGADSCTVEALFDVAKVPLAAPLLEDLGVEACQEDQLVLRRVFSSSGTNRQFINGSPSTLQVLKQIGEILVDMHGPHDHQSLLRPEAQLRILDAFAGLDKSRGEFAALLRDLRQVEEEKQALVVDDRTLQQQIDLLNHQVNEIEAAKLSPDEEGKVESEYLLASNGQKLLDLVGRALDGLGDGDASATAALAQAQRALRDLAALDPAAVVMEEAGAALATQLQELHGELGRYAGKIDIDPDRLQFLSERMTLIQGFKRKYGSSLQQVIEHGLAAREKLTQLQGREEELAKLEAKVVSITRAMQKTGMALRVARQKTIPKLTQVVSRHLKELGFAQSSFAAELSSSEPTALGIDAMEFRFTPNAGEPAHPLREIASSGEMARVMLALKTALADQDQVPVLVFDEVDANVGGQIGHQVGEKMAQIGKRHQVICITHLAQVAVHGRNHHVVVKETTKGRTFTRIESLDADRRVEEIARMLGGKGPTAVKHAREMLSAVSTGA